MVMQNTIYTVHCDVHILKFEIGDDMRDRMGKMPDTT
jgi:hypothetical protein